jgi:hypothetical protein
MRYATCYRPGTTRVVAYVHMEEDGLLRLARPLAKGADLTIDYPATVVRRATPAPEGTTPLGAGPDGTYHA